LKDDKPRHGTACPITIHEGKAYCPTAAGCIACVDLRSRRFLWAFRYPRDDLPKTSRDETRVRPDTTHATHMPTREIWQEVFLKIAGDVLVFASPDSDRLYVLDARSGTPRWNVAREQGIFLAGPVDDRILIMGSHQATARAVADGRRLWT